jgi:limonene-1,2-epoxide hydrolase
VSDSPTETVKRFCAAWSHNDVDALMAFFTDDAVYHNIPIDPVKGVDTIRSTIEGFTQGVEKIEFRVDNIAADGNVVMTERVDVFHLPGKTIELPVMGTFEVNDGKIAAWRDYFDMQQFMSQMSS